MGGDLPSSAFGTSARLPYYYRYSRIGRKKATPVPPPPYFAADCDLTTSKTATFFLSLSLRKPGQRPNSARAAGGGGGGAQNGSEAQAQHGGLTLQFVSDAKLQHVWDVLQTSHRVCFLFCRGVLYQRQNRMREAVKSYEEAIHFRPKLVCELPTKVLIYN